MSLRERGEGLEASIVSPRLPEAAVMMLTVSKTEEGTVTLRGLARVR